MSSAERVFDVLIEVEGDFQLVPRQMTWEAVQQFGKSNDKNFAAYQDVADAVDNPGEFRVYRLECDNPPALEVMQSDHLLLLRKDVSPEEMEEIKKQEQGSAAQAKAANSD